MRISDWSSDVCSSDLRRRIRDWISGDSIVESAPLMLSTGTVASRSNPCHIVAAGGGCVHRYTSLIAGSKSSHTDPSASVRQRRSTNRGQSSLDRKRVVSGKRVSVRVSLGGGGA